MSRLWNFIPSEFIAVGEKYFGNKSEKYLQDVPYPRLNINKNTLIDSSRMHTVNIRDYTVRVGHVCSTFERTAQRIPHILSLPRRSLTLRCL